MYTSLHSWLIRLLSIQLSGKGRAAVTGNYQRSRT
jgi:hypothetical protein